MQQTRDVTATIKTMVCTKRKGISPKCIGEKEGELVQKLNGQNISC